MATDEVGLSAYSDHRFSPSTNESWSNMYGYIPEGARVLDVGCSSGNFGEALERLKHCTVVGVDLDAADIAEAATKITTALVFDITSAESLDVLGRFDVVVFADVLEHLVDPRGALARIRPLLTEGGCVVYSIPNMTHASVRLDLLGGVFGYTETGILDKTHLHFYDRAEVDDIFLSSGFAVTDHNPVVFPYPSDLIRDSLGSLGLEQSASDSDSDSDSDSEFERMLARTDGSILQFVGRAAPALEPSTPHERQRTFPPAEINEFVERLRLETETARTETRAVHGELDSAMERAEAERARAEAETARADSERARADAADTELHRLQERIGDLRRNPVGFALKRLRRSGD